MFSREYVASELNGVHAAMKVGCPEKSAGVQAHKWLKIPKVRAFVDKLLLERSKRLEIDSDWVLRRLVRLADYDVRKFYKEDGTLKQVSELDDDTAFALAGFEVEVAFEHFGKGQAKPSGDIKKIKFVDRGINLERIGRNLKMFTDKLEVTGLEGLADALAKARRRRGGK